MSDLDRSAASPSSPEDQFSQDFSDVFALLRPVNPPAQEAFQDVVKTVIGHPERYDHVRRSIRLEPERSVRATSVFTEHEDTIEQEYQWTGTFALSLRARPRDSGEGWTLGTGRGLSASQGVDIMLAPASQNSVAGKHALFLFHQDSGRMVLLARHKIRLSGADPEFITASETRLLSHNQYISIGLCLYNFQYTDFADSQAFRAELSNFMKDHHGSGWAIHRSLSSASVHDQLTIGEFTFSLGAFAKGTFGEVTAGLTQKGRTVAIKRIFKPDPKKLAAHEELMSYIGEHRNVLALVDMIKNFEASVVPVAYCVYKPLVMASLYDVINLYESDISAQYTLLRDFLEGLRYLHDDKGIMHRDVKPANLGVIFTPLRGVLLDLDAATRKATSFNHGHGTLSYLAPEIIVIKEQRYPAEYLEPYEKNVDIWALGLSAFTFYNGHRNFGWRADGRFQEYVTGASYGEFQDDLQKKKDNASGKEAIDLLFLIARMTEWDPSVRVSAHWALSVLSTAGQKPGLIAPKSGEKRKAEET
ncbi:hypothetical protein MMC07_003722 [Pseudocyphellaria aurata]|nr:hypothetical protein [Pseudocyphellaria aurata]